MQEPLARATAASFRPVIVRLLKARVKSPARDDSPIMPNHQPSALVLIIEVKRVLAYDCRRTRNNPGLGIMTLIPNSELSPPVRSSDAAQLVPRRRRCRTAAAGALHLSRPRLCERYVLVSVVLPGADGARSST